MIDAKAETAIGKVRRIRKARNDVSNIDGVGVLEIVEVFGPIDNRIRLSKSAFNEEGRVTRIRVSSGATSVSCRTFYSKLPSKIIGGWSLQSDLAIRWIHFYNKN